MIHYLILVCLLRSNSLEGIKNSCQLQPATMSPFLPFVPNCRVGLGTGFGINSELSQEWFKNFGSLTVPGVLPQLYLSKMTSHLSRLLLGKENVLLETVYDGHGN